MRNWYTKHSHSINISLPEQFHNDILMMKRTLQSYFGLMPWINHLRPRCWSTFWKSTFIPQLDCRFDISDSIFSLFCILTYAVLYVLINHIILGFTFTSLIMFFILIKYSCTNSFHRRSLYTFYYLMMPMIFATNENMYVCNTSLANIDPHGYKRAVLYYMIMDIVAYLTLIAHVIRPYTNI